MAWSIFKQGGGEAVAVGWAKQFLSALGAPVTPGNVQFIYQWEKAEGGGGKYNPLNTGPVRQHPEWTTTGEQFGGGAADYTSWETGILGPKYFLEHYQQATYSRILSALKNDDPVGARAALIASPWAASHYDYGRAWPNVSVPGVTAVLPPMGTSPGSLVAGFTPVGLTDDDTCAWKIKGLGQSYCVASKLQVRHTAGVALMVSGGAVMLLGIVLLAAFAIGGEFIPGASKVMGVVGKLK